MKKPLPLLRGEHGQLSTFPLHNCTSNLDCSLNGACTSEGHCRCDAPWRGQACGTIGYNATTPAIAKDIWPISDTAHNTWGGPIVGPDPNGTFHAFIPLYRNGSLWGASVAKHGVATAVAGPFSWSTLPDIKTGINPAFLSFRNASGSYHTIWDESFGVKIATSLDGPFLKVGGFALPSPKQPNPAPIYHDNAFFLVTQHTKSVWTTPSLAPGAVWTLHGNISQGNTTLPTNVHVEDPFMWIDKRNNWHIINHAYDTTQHAQCGTSTVSAHFFSVDGKEWHLIGGLEPYGHTVSFDDGTTHTYSTLERPNIFFEGGVMTHLVVAVDLDVGDEGCANRTSGWCKREAKRPCCCNCCKFDDHTGTLVIALNVRN